ncbi:hypothetical protein [Achromobacter sp. Marseille-Q4962]|uniref:hypothetical protein n=1 Tax=Achromobacter sp. Marseille-Q4962 TaxID=2942202 RepID=UPI0020739157|nr:hypothetical protein [Achromobacter sp. Marseille-Q4962]
MDIVLAFAPFAVFAVLERSVGVLEGLAAGAAAAACLLLRDWVSPERRVKPLESGSFLLLAGLMLYAPMAGGDGWSVAEARLRVDGGMLAVVLLTMLLRRPFTLEYAREREPEYVWKNRRYRRMNYVVTGAWAAAFAVMAAADMALLRWPWLSPALAVAATVAALYGAARFTRWYPSRDSALP